MGSSHRWLSLMDAFQNAAVESSGWYPALEGLADVTGSRCGQLLGLSAPGSDGIDLEAFNVVTDFAPDELERFASAGGHDPAFNPRVRAGMSARVLEVLSEADFLSTDEHRRHPHYLEFARPYDVPFICLTNVVRQDGLTIGLAVLRSEGQGHITTAQRALFAAAAPFVRAAVRTQLALEGQCGALLEGMLEALSIPGFLCDRRGMVRAVTPAAENAVSAGGIQLVKGRLQLPRPEDSRRLEEAIRAAADPTGPRRPMFHTVVARGPDGALPLILDVIALPARDYEFTFAPRVLVTSGAPQPAEQRRADVLRAAYALTEAEADIALRLSAGESACVIAAARRVTVGTVRAQLKASMAKLGVKRQAALVARLGQLRL